MEEVRKVSLGTSGSSRAGKSVSSLAAFRATAGVNEMGCNLLENSVYELNDGGGLKSTSNLIELCDKQIHE
jgi:hypothetical protein